MSTASSNRRRWSHLLALAALAMLPSACESASGPEPGEPGLHVVAGAGIADTANHRPTQDLVVSVLGGDGLPLVGAEVYYAAAGVTVANVGTESFMTHLMVPTDSRGRSAVALRLGNQAREAFIEILTYAVPSLDTVRFTVLPGNPTGVRGFPRDTTLTTGASYSLRSTTIDRNSNQRTGGATLESSGDVLQIDAFGRITALAPGEGWVRLRGPSPVFFPSLDSVRVAVVPVARVAYNAPAGLSTRDLTGANERVIAPTAVTEPTWVPGGTRLVGSGQGALLQVDLQGARTTVPLSGVVNPHWPEYSRDGQWIYFQAERSGQAGSSVYRAKPDGTALTLVAEGGVMPTPSPDGTKVAFISGQTLTIRELSSGVEWRVPGTPAMTPRWSPDGQWIAFVKTPFGELLLVRPDGTGLRQVGSHGLHPGITWSPDSRWILGSDDRVTLTDITSGKMMHSGWTGGRSPAWQP